ncbi:MAG: hypothetical protein IJ620_04415, partial [Bacteroidales bacterium]|nr:hypothetical protein [Bacteroidales bacterium]
PSKVRLIAEAKSLIAWLREAIKAREAMLKEVKEKTMETFCEEHEEYTMPKRVDAKDVKYKSLTIDDVVGEMSVKERNRYYELEAYCAEIGKYIHPDGAFARMREEYMDHLRHPHEAKGTGRDMLIYTYSPTVAKEDVERVFFEMQREYRELQSELNGMKHRIESAVSADELKKRALLNKDNESYRSEIEQLTGALEAWRLEESKRVSDMKIVIPKSLENVYRKISDLSKQKTKSDKKKDK